MDDDRFHRFATSFSSFGVPMFQNRGIFLIFHLIRPEKRGSDLSSSLLRMG
jgi:hypothetical protein